MESKEKNSIVSALVRRMKEDKRFELAVYGIFIAAGLLLYGISAIGQRAEKAEHVSAAAETYPQFTGSVAETEARLKSALSCIRGVGEVEVMITCGYRKEEYETALFRMPENTSQEDDPKQNGSNLWWESGEEEQQPEKTASVCGVIVIAEGADDISVRLDIQKAVGTVLGIDAACIEVFKMKNEEGRE